MADLPSAHVPSKFRPAPGSPSWGKRIFVLLVVLVGGWYVHFLYVNNRFDPVEWAIANARKTNTVDGYLNAVHFEPDPGKQRQIAAALRPDLEKLQARARAALKAAAVPRPAGLDRLFTTLLARFDTTITFIAERPTIDTTSFTDFAARAAQPGATVATFGLDILQPGPCGDGIDDAFAEALGSSILHVTAYDAHPSPWIKARYAISASGEAYTTANGLRIFPGIRITGSFDLVDDAGPIATVAMTDESPSAIKFSSAYLSSAFEGGQDDDVGRALVRATCKASGYRLLEQLTGWKPPRDEGAPATAQAHIDACEAKGESGECNAAGIALRDGTDGVAVDRERAETLFKKGCDGEGIASGDACVAYTYLALPRVKDAGMMRQADYWSEIRRAVKHACERHSAVACTRYGEVELEPDWNGRASEPAVRHHALDDLVRGCVLGDARGCRQAALLVVDAPIMAAYGTVLPDAAAALGGPPVPAKRIPEQIRGFALGKDRIFAVGWADWRVDDDGHAVYYVASTSSASALATRLDALVTDHSARLYRPTALPFGIPAPPPGTASVYGIMAEVPSADLVGGDACTECTGLANSEALATGCICLPLAVVK